MALLRPGLSFRDYARAAWKLEQQVLLTADGPELLSTFRFEESLS
jgi:hypothetical protein